MPTRAKFIYFVLALILAFTGLAAVAATAVQADSLLNSEQLESAGFGSGTLSSPSQVIAGECPGGGPPICP